MTDREKHIEFVIVKLQQASEAVEAVLRAERNNNSTSTLFTAIMLGKLEQANQEIREFLGAAQTYQDAE